MKKSVAEIQELFPLDFAIAESPGKILQDRFEITSDIAVDKSVADIQVMFPPDSLVVEFKMESPEKYSATLRLKCTGKEEFKSWLASYQKLCRTIYRVAATVRTTGKTVLYKAVYRCQHNTYPESHLNRVRKPSRKHTGCNAKLNVTVKSSIEGRVVRSKDKLRGEYPTIVRIRHDHNHIPDDVDVTRSPNIHFLRDVHQFEVASDMADEESVADIQELFPLDSVIGESKVQSPEKILHHRLEVASDIAVEKSVAGIQGLFLPDSVIVDSNVKSQEKCSATLQMKCTGKGVELWLAAYPKLSGNIVSIRRDHNHIPDGVEVTQSPNIHFLRDVRQLEVASDVAVEESVADIQELFPQDSVVGESKVQSPEKILQHQFEVASDIAVEESVPDIQELFPPDSVIVEYKVESSEKYSATLRLKCTGKEEFKLWLAAYQKLSGTVYRVAATKPTTGKTVLYKAVYRCQHNTYPKSHLNRVKKPRKHTGCCAKLKVTVKSPIVGRIVRSKDTLRGEYPTIVNVTHDHNHILDGAGALILKDPNEKGRRKILQLRNRHCPAVVHLRRSSS